MGPDTLNIYVWSREGGLIQKLPLEANATAKKLVSEQGHPHRCKKRSLLLGILLGTAAVVSLLQPGPLLCSSLCPPSQQVLASTGLRGLTPSFLQTASAELFSNGHAQGRPLKSISDAPLRLGL
jgi:hypothetical protein